MSKFEGIAIREVESSDLEAFYERQLDPEAIEECILRLDLDQGDTRVQDERELPLIGL